MKKLAAGVGVMALVVAAQLAFAQDNSRNSNTPGAADSAMTITGDTCAGWTKGGGAAVGKPSPGRTAASSSSMDASTEAACAAADASSSSAAAAGQSYSAKAGKTGATK